MATCPLCSAAVAAGSLEAHLRLELAYAESRCPLCPASFVGDDDVRRHFAGPLANHPGEEERVLMLPAEASKEGRLVKLLRLAGGGPAAVEARVCVCGRCPLPCRDDLGLHSAWQPTAREDFSLSNGPEPTSQEAEDQDWRVEEAPVARKRPRAASPRFERPVPEASEPEGLQPDQEPFDFGQREETNSAQAFRVKAELEDVKPELSSDGKVGCLLCGLRVGREAFKHHALGAHTAARPFQCALCPLKAKQRRELAKHQKTEHDVQMSKDTLIFSGSEAEVERRTEECFGSVRDVDWARLRCKPCDKLLNKKNVKRHIVAAHIKKPLHSCRLCPYTNMEYSAGFLNVHVRKVHGVEPGPESVDSAQAAHYAPIVKSLMDELFV